MAILFRSIISLSIASLLSLSFAMASQAGMIGTDEVLRQQAVDHVTVAMQSEEVAQQLAAYGVSQHDVEARIAAMSDDELAALSVHFDEIPAGSGVIGVLGVTFLVLLILELVGVINVFASF